MDQAAEIVEQAIYTMMQSMEAEDGNLYRSTLEAYGDMSRTLNALQESAKVVKKDVAAIMALTTKGDTQVIRERLLCMSVNVKQMAMIAIRMAATVEKAEETVNALGGGDLLDMLDEQ